MWTWRSMEWMSWKNRVMNEETLGRVGKKMRILNNIKRERGFVWDAIWGKQKVMCW